MQLALDLANLAWTVFEQRRRARMGTIVALHPKATRVVKSSRAQEFGAAGNIDYNTTHTENAWPTAMGAEMGEQVGSNH
ncbi:hypothetical protein [Streptomyces sp. NPDC047985]|uniref:hypothetical protein n=1 Tax=Streptomyces sp. NPDC047985 TaxID=3155384 RepID=UPI00343228B3